MRKLMFCIAFIAFTGTMLQAQCTQSNQNGIHVVQYGETLYRISKQYNITIDNIREWNGMQFNEILSVCQVLKVNGPEVFVDRGRAQTQTTRYTPTPRSTYQKQTGGKHVVRQGETIAQIANLYGYSEQRFREFNVLQAGQELTLGSVLLSTDCACTRAAYSEHSNGLFSGQWNEQLIAETTNNYTSTANNYTPPVNANYVNPYYTPPSEHTKSPQYTNNNDERGFATSWGRAANNNQRNTNNYNGNTSNNTTWRQAPTNTNPPVANNGRQNASAYNNERSPGAYMTNEEQTMIDEINLVRSNPAGYIQYVEQYIRDIRSGKAFGSSTNVAYELIDELKRTPPLTVLKPVECLYQAAKSHGQEAVRKGSSDHQGLDGSWPWDRAKRACPQMTDGNENLVGGPSNIREAVMLLLVDDGISNRGHRKTLLQKDWKYVACYKSGKVGRMPNSWVQMFGN